MNPLKSIPGTIISGFVLAIVIAVYDQSDVTNAMWSITVWLHVFFGVIWIGLLYYFNFVQVPAVGQALADGDPGPAAINKYVAPKALWWFRWGAMATIVTGLLLAYISGYIHNAMTLTLVGGGGPNELFIGIGMWLGIIMWYNVWFVIWPNQKRALGIVEAEADAKASSARTAMLFSRTNTLLSIPMLFCMVLAQNIF